MPEFTGSTDEKHVFTLPSEIERVRWLRRQAAPGGIVGLQIRTLFCAIGSQIEIRLVDAQGTVHDTISGTLHAEELNLQLRVPDEAVGGLLAKVRMPNHGLSADSEALLILDPVRVYGARWSTKTVKRGDIVTLTAEAKDAPDGRKAPVRIYERDKRRGAHDPVTRLRPRVESETVMVKYRFQYPGDVADIVPEWEAPNGYEQPEFFYTVDVSGVRADSKDAKQRGVMTFADDLTLQVVDAGTGAPHTDQDVEVTLADGSTQTATTNGSGTAELTDVPPGPAKVTLPELGAPDTEAEAGKPAETAVSVRKEPNRTPGPALVSTGPPCRIRVERRRRGPTA